MVCNKINNALNPFKKLFESNLYLAVFMFLEQ